MEKTRVPKGKRYWCIRIFAGIIEVFSLTELGLSEDDTFRESGNYFHTKEEAESMANKILAVLNGADVIEMPSGEEIENSFTRDYNGVYNCAFNAGRKDGIEWLKSKIVK